jgi:hypothetical protein
MVGAGEWGAPGDLLANGRPVVLDRPPVAIGATGEIYRGRTEAGESIAVKIARPADHVATAGGSGVTDETIAGWFAQERRWLMALDGKAGGHGEGPRFPAPVEITFNGPSLPPAVVGMEWIGGRSLRRALESLRLGRTVWSDAVSYSVGRWMSDVLAALHMAAAHDPPGVYFDVAPDNFVVGEYSGRVTALDAGSIVSVAEPRAEIPMRRPFIPRAFMGAYEDAIRTIDTAEGFDLAIGLVLAMVAKMFASGLSVAVCREGVDPPLGQFNTGCGLRPWLVAFFSWAMTGSVNRTECPGYEPGELEHLVGPGRLFLASSWLADRCSSLKADGWSSSRAMRGYGGAGSLVW